MHPSSVSQLCYILDYKKTLAMARLGQMGTNSTEHVFTASGVDAVGEVVMCVDILPQPNGEHKINVKGKKKSS